MAIKPLYPRPQRVYTPPEGLPPLGEEEDNSASKGFLGGGTYTLGGGYLSPSGRYTNPAGSYPATGRVTGGSIVADTDVTPKPTGNPFRDTGNADTRTPEQIEYDKLKLDELRQRLGGGTALERSGAQSEIDLRNAQTKKILAGLDTAQSSADAESNRLKERGQNLDDKLQRDIAAGNWREAARTRNAQREIKNQQTVLDYHGQVLGLLGMFASHPMLFQTSVNQLPQLFGALGKPQQIGLENIGGEQGSPPFLSNPDYRLQGSEGPYNQFTGIAPPTGLGAPNIGPAQPSANDWVSGTYINNPTGPGSAPNAIRPSWIPGVTTPTPGLQPGANPSGAGTVLPAQPSLGAGGGLNAQGQLVGTPLATFGGPAGAKLPVGGQPSIGQNIGEGNFSGPYGANNTFPGQQSPVIAPFRAWNGQTYTRLTDVPPQPYQRGQQALPWGEIDTLYREYGNGDIGAAEFQERRAELAKRGITQETPQGRLATAPQPTGGLPALPQPASAPTGTPTLQQFTNPDGSVDFAALQRWMASLGPIAGFLPNAPRRNVSGGR